MNWIKSHAMDTDTFEFIACQSEERKSQFPEIGEEACLEALHLVASDGRILAGDKSLPEILGNLRYFRWLAIFFKIPVFSLLSYFVHRRIANNRYIISQTILPLSREKI
jgi:predicted DCC family thiol-disulfide oxidoreductase YuxK